MKKHNINPDSQKNSLAISTPPVTSTIFDTQGNLSPVEECHSVKDIGQVNVHTTLVFEAAMGTAAAAFFNPGLINKAKLRKLSEVLMEIIALPETYDTDSARKAVYDSLGMHS